MCEICAEFEPWTDECVYKDIAPNGGTLEAQTNNEPIVFTVDQIAFQLTNTFWGGSSISFDASAGDTLAVDLSGLDQGGQIMARQALNAWSDVTGLMFSETLGAQTAPSATLAEGPDASSGTFTAYSMAVGENFEGNLVLGGDRDGVAITLAAGQKITVELSGDARNGNALLDPYLRLRDSNGVVLIENDDFEGSDSLVSFQATAAGTYYIQAGSYLDVATGDYVISVRDIPSSDIVFRDDQAGAFASLTGSGSTITQAEVNINANWAGGLDRIDSYYYQTFVHEIGHALGLGHAGNYNGSAVYGQDNSYANDSWHASVMSYFSQSENTWLDASFAYVVAPQVADIVAVQNLYGAAEVRTGDDTYGNNGTTGTYLDTAFDLTNPVSFTVFDTGGTDTFDFADFDSDQRLDLREESYSDLAGLNGNIGIARGTVIENGKTGIGNDTLIGNQASNGLSSGSGQDSINGGAGHDAIYGQAGDDLLTGDVGRDFAQGGTGDDLIAGGNDGDLLVGDVLTLAELADAYPSWTPPTDAQSQLDDGNLIAIWEDILFDVYGIA